MRGSHPQRDKGAQRVADEIDGADDVGTVKLLDHPGREIGGLRPARQVERVDRSRLPELGGHGVPPSGGAGQSVDADQREVGSSLVRIECDSVVVAGVEVAHDRFPCTPFATRHPFVPRSSARIARPGRWSGCDVGVVSTRMTGVNPNAILSQGGLARRDIPAGRGFRPRPGLSRPASVCCARMLP